MTALFEKYVGKLNGFGIGRYAAEAAKDKNRISILFDGEEIAFYDLSSFCFNLRYLWFDLPPDEALSPKTQKLVLTGLLCSGIIVVLFGKERLEDALVFPREDEDADWFIPLWFAPASGQCSGVYQISVPVVHLETDPNDYQICLHLSRYKGNFTFHLDAIKIPPKVLSKRLFERIAALVWC